MKKKDNKPSIPKDRDEKNIFISDYLNQSMIELHWNNSTLVDTYKKGKK